LPSSVPERENFCHDQYSGKGDGTLFGKIRKILCSVKTTIAILIAIALFSVIGTLLPQGHPGDTADSYSLIFSIFNTLQFYDIFHSFWFVLLAFLLALNLIFCTWYRLLSASLPWPPKNHSESKKFPDPPGGEAKILHSNHPLAEEARHCETVLKKYFRTLSRKDRENETVLHAEKGILSTYGVYMIHASILLVLLGFILDAFLGIEGTMTIMEGESDHLLYLQGEKGVRKLDFDVRCDRFLLSLYDTGAPKMYRSDLTFLKNGKDLHKDTLLVNHPIAFGGLRFYQASYGEVPAAQAAITYFRQGEKDVSVLSMKGREYPLPTGNASFEVIRIEENFMNMGPAVKIRIHSPAGNTQFWIFQHIQSLRETYPDIFHTMAIFNPEIFKPFVFSLDSIKNRYYTGLQVMKEPGVPWVGCGAFLMVFGFILVFIYPHRQLWVVIRKTNAGSSIGIYGRSRRDPAGLNREMTELAGRLQSEEGIG